MSAECASLETAVDAFQRMLYGLGGEGLVPPHSLNAVRRRSWNANPAITGHIASLVGTARGARKSGLRDSELVAAQRLVRARERLWREMARTLDACVDVAMNRLRTWMRVVHGLRIEMFDALALRAALDALALARPRRFVEMLCCAAPGMATRAVTAYLLALRRVAEGYCVQKETL